MSTVLIGGTAVGLTVGLALMAVAWLLENTALGAKLDRAVARALEAGVR